MAITAGVSIVEEGVPGQGCEVYIFISEDGEGKGDRRALGFLNESNICTHTC